MEGANNFLFSKDSARTIFTHLAATIEQHWDAVCEEAELGEVDKKTFLGKAVPKPLFDGEIKKSLFPVSDYLKSSHFSAGAPAYVQ